MLGSTVSKQRTCKASSRQRDAQQHPASCSRVHQELSTAPPLAQDSSVPAESSLQVGLPLPWDSQELGPWEEQGPWSPLNLDYRNETWRSMPEEGLQLPYGAARSWGEGLLPLCSPKSCKPGAGTWREAALRGQGLTSPAQRSPSSGGRAQPQGPC